MCGARGSMWGDAEEKLAPAGEGSVRTCLRGPPPGQEVLWQAGSGGASQEETSAQRGETRSERGAKRGETRSE